VKKNIIEVKKIQEKKKLDAERKKLDSNILETAEDTGEDSQAIQQ